MVVDHDAALQRGHGRAGLVGAIEGVGRRRGGVQPTGRPGDAEARFVEAAHRRGCDAFANGTIDRRQRFRLAANPTGHGRAAGRRPEQVLQDLRGSFFGHELLSVEVDARRLDALAILGRRNHAFGEGGARASAASRAVVDRRAVLGHDQRLLRKIENLALFVAGLRIRQKPRPAMRASLGRVLDNPVGLGDLAQRIAAMAFLAPARLACARAQAPQYARLLLQPVARWRLGAVGAVQVQPSPKLRVLRFKRLYPAHQRGDKLFDFGRQNHPTLESETDLLVSKNHNAEIDQAPDVAFRTHPGLAVTNFKTAAFNYAV